MDGAYSSANLAGSVIIGSTGESRAAFGVLGTSVSFPHIENAINPYDPPFLGLQAGFGIRTRVRGVTFTGDLLLHALLSDFGAESETLARYTTLAFGIVH